MRLGSWFAGIDLDFCAVTAALGCSTDDGPPRILGCQRIDVPLAERNSAAPSPTALDAVMRFAEWFRLESGGALSSVALALPESALQEVPISDERNFGSAVVVDRATIATMREHALRRVRPLGTLTTWVHSATFLDGRRYDDPPLGHHATRISVEFTAWVARPAFVEPVIHVLEQCGFAVGLVAPRLEATAELVLTPGERRDGAILMTISDRDSSVAVVAGGEVVDLFPVPMGREPLLAELARACSVSANVVERLDLGLMLDRVPSDPMVQRVRTVISGWGAALFTGVRRRVDNRNLGWRVQTGVVIAAPQRAFPTLDDVATRALGMSARFAAQSSMPAVARSVTPATFAAVGLLPLEWRAVSAGIDDDAPDFVAAAQGERMSRVDVTGRRGLGQAFGRWLREFVPVDH